MNEFGKTIRKWAIFSALVMLVLVSGACSSDDGDNDDREDDASEQVTPTVEPTATVVPLDVNAVWTRIHNRGLLDASRYETREEWQATQQTSLGVTSVTHSMQMRATVNVTIGINLEDVTLDDIVADDENQTVTITLPQAQPIECFMDDIEYFDRSCVAVCGDLERLLRENALTSVLDSQGLATALVNASENAQSVVAGLIDPLANGYEIFFVENPEVPPPLENSSCG